MATQRPRAAKINSLGIFFLFLFLTGVISVSVSTYLRYRETILSFNRVPLNNSAFVGVNEKKSSKPVKIVVKDAFIDLDIEDGEIIDGIWQISEKYASYLVSSAKPAENGNIVIYGHNKQNIFGNLITHAKVGQEIDIYLEDASIRKYTISKIKTVTPDAVSEISPTNYEVLTIYTCTGLFDSKRLIIKAQPVN